MQHGSTTVGGSGRRPGRGARAARLVPLVRASHFQPTVAVTTFTTALAVSAGRGRGAVLVGAAVLAGQLTVGWSNDYLDRHRDRRAGRIDKPLAADEVDPATVRTCIAGAAFACVPLSLASGWQAGGVHLAAVSVALTYNRWLKSSVLSVVPYVVAFGALPAFVSLGLAGHPRPAAWATVAAALLGGGAHFVNTLPDLATDALTGVRGLPHRLGPQLSLLAGTLLLGSATTVVAVAPHSALGRVGTAAVVASCVAVAGVVLMTALGRPRAAWTMSLVSAAATVALYVARGDLTS